MTEREFIRRLKALLVEAEASGLSPLLLEAIMLRLIKEDWR